MSRLPIVTSLSPVLSDAPHDGAELRLLGALDLLRVEDAAAVLTQSRRVALLAVLAVESPRGFVRRDRLVSLLWPEHDTASARGALRKAVHALRQTLGDDALMRRGDEELRLDASRVWCDVAAFDAAHDAGRHARALELYRGPLLEAFHSGVHEFSQWLDAERELRREKAVASAWALASQLEGAQDLSRAAYWARRVARLAGTDERRVRAAMGLLARAGNRADALRIYDDFAAFLQRDFDVTPSAETQAVAESLRSS